MRGCSALGPWRDMFSGIEEEMARSTEVGVLVHRVIGDLAACTRYPSPDVIMAAADRCLSHFRPIEVRAHRQTIAGAVGSYFWHLLPPARFQFLGAELHLGTGRTDLLWGDQSGAVVVDELKTGHVRALSSAATAQQVHKYLAGGSALWGAAFLGVRLLSTASPRQSLMVHPDGHRQF